MLPLGTIVPPFVHGETCVLPCKDQSENPETKDRAGQLSNAQERPKFRVYQPQECCAWQGVFYSSASQNHARGECSAGSNPPVGVAHANQVELDG